ncbi:phosphotransferase enzyme family protein [Thiocystis violascens]|uniref:Putative homoserine kinase type II (Protein kinase fold) n=1 Tax=Thiocystis violascens (strain ATCC 17096 / DSM 198 / 6111) TaxID=765911 RepID=I3YCI1_THIV6|nr:aminoglycoside phosphotransferase family protein [Thiocystis violascens]AFL74699.1 putative homoserine kinase type II (protein kinase fold) [Thiocystis violascens DSM 198]
MIINRSLPITPLGQSFSRMRQQPPHCHEIAARFAIAHPLGAIEPLGRGLINDTFSLDAGGQRYVLQRINGAVFPAPERIMANLRVLGAHLAERADTGLRLPSLIATREGGDFLRDADGAIWRLMEFIPNAVTLTRIEHDAQAREVGAVLGRFHRLAASLHSERLALSLPGFHATPEYLTRFLAVAGQEARQEGQAIRDCLDFVLERRGLADVLEAAQASGAIPLRVTHGDPKLDNILFARDGGHALALIDLDTVQPGLIQHDLGDCLRSCCNRGGEGTRDPAGVRFDMTLCAGILAGYANETRGVLAQADIDLLYDAIRLMPFELGLRFLTDHLEGDRYFRIDEPGQNLRKARIQFALVAEIERQEEALRVLIATCFAHALN